jgi:hypothetical protein
LPNISTRYTRCTRRDAGFIVCSSGVRDIHP